eukprot:6812581-Lingulodinium_polyedra.AAC.1
MVDKKDPHSAVLPRGTIYVKDVSFYILKPVLASLAKVGQEIFENLENASHECTRLWICITGGNPKMKLPQREMAYAKFLEWATTRHEFCGSQLRRLMLTEKGTLDWNTNVGVYRLIPNCTKEVVQFVAQHRHGMRVDILSYNIKWGEVGLAWNIEGNDTDETAELTNACQGNAIKLKRLFNIAQEEGRLLPPPAQ